MKKVYGRRMAIPMSAVLVFVLAAGMTGAQGSPAQGKAQLQLPSRGKITYEIAAKILAAEPKALILDVRTLEEYAAGHIPGAGILPYDRIDAASAQKAIGAPDRVVIVYCRSGRRSEIAMKALAALGYTRVYDLGPVDAWKGKLATGLPAPAK